MLGALKWYQLAHENDNNTPFSIWDYRQQQFQQVLKLAPSDGTNKDGFVGAADSFNYRVLNEAIHLWNETLADVNNTNKVLLTVYNAIV